MVVQGSPTKTVQETKEETEINPKETPEAKEAESQDSDTEFTVETEELDELQVHFIELLRIRIIIKRPCALYLS